MEGRWWCSWSARPPSDREVGEKSVAHALSAFSALDLWSDFASAPLGRCLRPYFSSTPPLIVGRISRSSHRGRSWRAPRALRSRSWIRRQPLFRAHSRQRADVTPGTPASLMLQGADGHRPVRWFYFWYFSASPGRWLREFV